MSEWQGYLAGVRQRRNEMRAARGKPLLREKYTARPDHGQNAPPAPSWDEAPGGCEETRGGDLQAVLQGHAAELAEAKRIIGELKDYAEQLESRVGELVAGAAPMAKTLRLPGVKKFLLEKFHPDKYPEADERQRALLTEATQTITAAYALADELHASE